MFPMDVFVREKNIALRAINAEKDLYKYVDIYKNCENSVYNVYFNIYKEYRKGKEQGEEEEEEEEGDISFFDSYKKGCHKNQRMMEKKVKEIIERKEVNEKSDDKSVKKSIDVLIYPCIHEINKNEKYFTSSCCSGRIVIFAEMGKRDEQPVNDVINFGTCKKLDTFEGTKNRSKENCTEGEEFLSYFKKKHTLSKNEEKEKYFSDQEKDTIFKSKRRSRYISPLNCAEKKLHKKKKKYILVLYSSHSHQNLEYYKHLLKNIWTLKGCYSTEIDLLPNKKNDLSLPNGHLGLKNEEKYKHFEKKNDHLCSFSDNENVKKFLTSKVKRRNLYIKYEPFIIHVKCVDLVSALKLLKIAQHAGLKQSGILNFKKFVTVAVRGSMRLEHFLGNNLMEKKKTVRLLDICNDKMSKNILQLAHFYHCYKEFFQKNDACFHFSCEICCDNSQLCGLKEEEKKIKKLNDKRNCAFPIGENSNRGGQWNRYELEAKRGNMKNGEINLSRYNVDLSEEGHILGKFVDSDDRLMEWKILPNKCDVQKFFVWGHDMFMQKSKIYLFGGFSKGVRNSKLRIFDTVSKELLVYDTELPRMAFHVFLRLDDNYAVIFGGRENPQNCTNQTWVYNIKKNSWTLAKIREISGGPKKGECNNGLAMGCYQSSEAPCCRYRHACAFVKRYKKEKKRNSDGNGSRSASGVYVFYVCGGVDVSGVALGDMWEGKLTVKEEENGECFVRWKKKSSLGERQEGELFVKNHSLVCNQRRNVIYIVGGYYCKGKDVSDEDGDEGGDEGGDKGGDRGGNRGGDKGGDRGGNRGGDRGGNRGGNSGGDDENPVASNEMAKHIGKMTFLYTYDIKKNKFTLTKCIGDDKFGYPLRRFSHCCCLLDCNMFLLIGGLNIHRTLNDIWLFRMKECKWHYMGKFPFQSTYVRSKVVSEKYHAYVIGGGCTVFTFGSFFDLPVYANCEKILNITARRTCDNSFSERRVSIGKVTISATGTVGNGTCLVKDRTRMVGVEKHLTPLVKKENNRSEESFMEEEQPTNCYFHFGKVREEERNEGIPDGNFTKKLYVVVRDRKFVKAVKTRLEEINNFDNTRKIYLSEGCEENLKVNGFFIPIKRKIELLKNYEHVNKFFFEKVYSCGNGDIYYVETNFKKEGRGNNKKKKLRKLFECFLNEKVSNYITNSERELILKAHTKYEIIGDILIFHYMHLKPIVELYRSLCRLTKKKGYVKLHVQEERKKKLKYNETTSLQDKRYCSNIVKEIERFWTDIKNIFNKCIEEEENKEKTVHLKVNNTFGKFIRLVKKRISLSKTVRWLSCGRRRKVKVNMGYIDSSAEEIPFNHRSSPLEKQVKGNLARGGKKIKSVAIYEKVKGKMRKNKIHLVSGKSLKTVHMENNVMYCLDLGKCMFSLGNGTEKERMKNMYLCEEKNRNIKENVVDLFCGVGYFTLPLLKFIGDKKINNYYACDINDISLKLFKKSLKLNSIKKKNLYIVKQDSFLMSEDVNIVRRCHRVLLGLLPESKGAWRNAFHLIDCTIGGILHIHGVGKHFFNDNFVCFLRTYDYLEEHANGYFSTFTSNLNLPQSGKNGKHVSAKYCSLMQEASTKCQKVDTLPKGKKNDKKGKHLIYLGNNVPPNLHFAQYVLHEIFKIALEDCVLNKINWEVSISNVERVKSYAPHVYHYVVDIRCIPILR
ncbi:conserved Plasmodium protein, unknown function [Plasmodium ovale]|uniref:tRNA(Phe) 7-[(3-amino-3-carboxypropyl)-4-demethylwyosine(37)-N(4)]-methyltransferase n=1 Tax=Plasmodium ovale TaxID=36330 RepID=A0A1D3TFS6_PLAOA|nr:conserved Plasmodium protein, unknown function [Plasmodium ovale]